MGLHSCETDFRDVKHEVCLSLTEEDYDHDACTRARSIASLTELDRANQITKRSDICLSRSNDASSGLVLT